jgi:hypothetical protein
VKSSFQALMALVVRDLHTRDAKALTELVVKLRGLRSVFWVDCDLLEAVIRRVDRALRGRS